MNKSPEQAIDADTAYELVRSGIEALCAEFKQVSDDIAAAKANLMRLPLAPVPLEDLKDGIIEFIEASGIRYSQATIRSRISAFCTGQMNGLDYEPDWFGKPLRFSSINGAITRNNATLHRAQLLSPNSGDNDDQILYFLFADLVKEGLRRIMADMTAAEFGYDKIDDDEIGTARATRRIAIAEEQERLNALVEQKSSINTKLVRLGYRVEELEK